jgi:hypothetical protein
MCVRAAAAVLGVAALAGCDDRSTPLPDPAPQPTKPPGPSRPTTQQLNDGPRQRVSLIPIPATIEVPASWKVETIGTGAVLRGPTPSDEVAIRLSAAEQLKSDQIKILIDVLREAGEKDKANQIAFRVTDPAPNVKMVERIYRESLQGLPELVRWRVNLIAPSSLYYQRYELSFTSLSREVYEKDESFLRRIVDSLQYDTAALSVPPLPGR